MTDQYFKPNNRFEAKRTIARKDFGMHQDEFNLKEIAEKRYLQENKDKRLYGDFRHSYTNERTKMHLKLVEAEDIRAIINRSPAVKTIEETTYSTYLNDKEDLPKLSILTNYHQIMRIMNKSYVKNPDLVRHFTLMQKTGVLESPTRSKKEQDIIDS